METEVIYLDDWTAVILAMKDLEPILFICYLNHHERGLIIYIDISLHIIKFEFELFSLY